MSENTFQQETSFEMGETMSEPKDKEPKVELSEESEQVEQNNEEKLTLELKETHDKLLRLAAEFENYKKISQREQLNSLKFANENIVLSLLPIIDNLEQAVAAGKKSDSAKDLVVGVEMVLKHFSDSLEKYGVEFINVLGQPFDPNRQEAIGEREDDQVEAGTVVEQMQKGCLLHGRLIRPARVIVSKRA